MTVQEKYEQRIAQLSAELKALQAEYVQWNLQREKEFPSLIRKCSSCGLTPAGPANFCPNCGGKMREIAIPDVAQENALADKATTVFSNIQAGVAFEEGLSNFVWRDRSVGKVRFDKDDEVWQREIEDHYRLIHLAIADLDARLRGLEPKQSPSAAHAKQAYPKLD